MLVLVVSTAIAVVLFELMMQQSRQGTVAMRVTIGTYGVFDDTVGVGYAPGSSSSYAYLDSTGRVLECLPTISKTNVDGFRGLDTRADYEAAAQRVLVGGDSFSQWHVDGKTIVDYTKSELNVRAYSAALLTVAGGTFGLEHMVAHLADALTRTRQPWWSPPRVRSASCARTRRRPMCSASTTGFLATS